MDDLLPPGTRLGTFEIVRRLGVGGMATVYEAIHLTLQKRVAVKILAPAFADRPDLRARFHREGLAAARIRHPNAVDVWDVGEQSGLVYLVMEHLEGETLSRAMHREGTMPPERIAEVLLPVMAAVAAAHRESIVHRDIKPSNIFLARTRDGQLVPKVLDFGISKIVDAQWDAGHSELTATADVLGTLHYMAPEQVRSTKHVDARGDQYALGVIMYECATAKRPFKADSPLATLRAVLDGSFVPPRAHVPDLAPRFDAMVLRAMSVDPAQRYGSVAELARELLAFAEPGVQNAWIPVFGAPDALLLEDPTVMDIPVAGSHTPTGSHGTLTDAPRSIDVPTRTLPPAERGARALAPLLAGAFLAVVGLAALGVTLLARPPAPAPTSAIVSAVPALAPAPRPAAPAPPAPAGYRVSVTAQPEDAAIAVDGVAVGRGSFARVFARDGVEHTLRVTAPGFQPYETRFRDTLPDGDVMLLPVDAAPAAPAPARPARRVAPRRPRSPGEMFY